MKRLKETDLSEHRKVPVDEEKAALAEAVIFLSTELDEIKSIITKEGAL